jgi:hypothetical protein
MRPAIALDSSNNIHVAWTDNTPGQFEIYYKKSTDGGSTWVNKRLSWNPGISGYPSIDAISSTHVHIVWFDESPGNWEIFHKMSQDGGVSWLTKRLTWNPTDSSAPTIAVKSTDIIHIVWENKNSGNWELFHKKSENGGTSWATQRLTWNPGDSKRPEIKMGSLGNVHVVWDDNTTGGRDIYYKRSTDQGSHWNTMQLTDTSDNSWFPDIAVDSSGAIHIVWDDRRHVANSEIYYIKGIQ